MNDDYFMTYKVGEAAYLFVKNNLSIPYPFQNDDRFYPEHFERRGKRQTDFYFKDMERQRIFMQELSTESALVNMADYHRAVDYLIGLTKSN